MSPDSTGTREAKVASSESGNLLDSFKEYFKHFCWCCLPPSKRLKYQEEHGEQKSIVKEENEGDEKSESLNESVSFVAGGMFLGNEYRAPGSAWKLSILLTHRLKGAVQGLVSARHVS